MLGAFGDAAAMLRHQMSPRADTFIFKLHYKVTVALLIACMILNCLSNFFGDPIQCIQDGAIRGETLNMYCWISSTFSVPNHWNDKIGPEAPHPGIGPLSGETVYHAYYQWVPFFLSLQAILFYLPHYIWRAIDCGKMKTIVQGLNETSYIIDEEGRKEKEKVLSKFFLQQLHRNNSWSIKFAFCEILNFINVVGNIYFTDKFLGYQFTTYGSEAISFMRKPFEERADPMVQVFPRVTKCTFHTYGKSGTIQVHDSMCVLALNIINEKIFVFVWFWFVILAILSGLQLIYRLITLISPAMRHSILKTKARLNTPAELDAINRKCLYGDWFLLFNLGRNLNNFVFSEFVTDLARVMDYESNNSNNMEMSPLNPSAPEGLDYPDNPNVKEKTY